MWTIFGISDYIKFYYIINIMQLTKWIQILSMRLKGNY